MAEPRTSERSLGELFGALTTQLGQLVHKEVELARTEMTANVVRTGRNATLIGVGGAVAYGGFLVVLAAAVGVLMALGLDLWLAALIVGLVVIGVGYALIQRGRSQLQSASIAPSRTIETLKDDAEWAKDQTR
jgi:Putative Actinobacterial Holin-X, holin superfamily III